MKHLAQALFHAMTTSVLFLVGCTTAFDDPYFSSAASRASVVIGKESAAPFRVVVLPFRAISKSVGTDTAELLTAELLKTRLYRNVTLSGTMVISAEPGSTEANMDVTAAVKYAESTGADGVIVGSVDEYQIVSSRGRFRPSVGIAARLILCKSGDIAWNINLLTRSDNSEVSLSEHAKTVVHEMVAGLYQSVRRINNAPESRTGNQMLPADMRPDTGETRLSRILPQSTADFCVSETGMREITITWSNVETYAKEVRLERSPAGDVLFQHIAAVAPRKSFYVDNGGATQLLDGTSYYYRIRVAYDNGDVSACSLPKRGTTASPPKPPHEIRTRSQHSRTIELSWPPPAPSGIVAYVIYRGTNHTDTSFSEVARVRDPAYVDVGDSALPLRESSAYFYRIRSVNSIGATGDLSELVSASTLPPPPPVQGLCASSNEFRKVSLSWQPCSGPDVVRYHVYRSRQPDGQNEVRVGLLNPDKATAFVDCADTGLPPGDGKDYYYSICAVDSAGIASIPQQPRVHGRTKAPPLPPFGIVASRNMPGAILITWRSHPSSEAQQFDIEAAGSASRRFKPFASVSISAPAEAVESNLPPATVRCYRLRSVDSNGLVTTWSETASGMSRSPPESPSNVVCTATNDVVQIEWSHPGDARLFRLWKPGILSDRLIGTTNQAPFVLSKEAACRLGSAYITAIDECGLESAPSSRIEPRSALP